MPNLNTSLLPGKVKIPYSLLNDTISFLEDLDIEDYQPQLIQLYGYILRAFRHKKLNIQNRDAYKKLIHSGILQDISEIDNYPNCRSFDEEPF